MKKIIRFPFKHLAVFCLFLVVINIGCKKFLDEKPDQKLAEPSSVEDVQALLDNYITMNTQSPNIGARSDDDFYLLDAYVNSLDLNSRNIYTWQKDAQEDNSWKTMYKVILSANLSLETLNKITRTSYNSLSYDNACGSALFFRSFAFAQLLEVYAKPYDSTTAKTDLGIPVRLHSDISTENKRNTIAEGFNQILSDTKKAITFLPSLGIPVSRPSKAAAYSLLSVTYLNLKDYHLAGLYADSALQLQNTLMNYNMIDSNQAKPFTKFNPEVIFSSATATSVTLYTSNQKVDTLLYSSYQTGDLRKPIFFKKISNNQYGFKGNYQGSIFGALFNGYAVDEMMLTRAECYARENNLLAAMADLNVLLNKRFKPSAFVSITATSKEDALSKILIERRKELLGRCKRWADLRRLNKDPLYVKTLKRVVAGQIYELSPNGMRYTFYIPFQVIAMAGLEQNER